MARNNWKPAPPSPTCEYQCSHGFACGAPTTHCYPAMGGGYGSCCTNHAHRHLPYCVTLAQAQRGETPQSVARHAEGEGNG